MKRRADGQQAFVAYKLVCLKRELRLPNRLLRDFSPPVFDFVDIWPHHQAQMG